MARNELLQLHHEDVSWEKASDKIPLELVRYFLGDLVQCLSTSVFLRGNRCLFLIDWPKVPNSAEVWNYMLENFLERKTSMEVGHYRFIYMLSHVGPKYEDLVEIYCHAHWSYPDSNFRAEDIWGAGTFHSLEHPEILYLPPNLPGSTPKKATLLPSQSACKTPDLEEMNYQGLVDLVKELLQERANRLSAPTPNKDPTVAGLVTMSQDSFVQSNPLCKV